MHSQVVLRNLDPARVYCLANPNDFYCGVAAMKGLGWVLEYGRKDGPKVLGGETAKDGDLLTVGDQVVMSRPRVMQEEYEREKLAVAARRSESIGQPGGSDPFRGPTGRIPQFTEDPREERVR
jgi:hypothetical protein